MLMAGLMMMVSHVYMYLQTCSVAYIKYTQLLVCQNTLIKIKNRLTFDQKTELCGHIK